MTKNKNKPIPIAKFLIFWMLAVYLLWPLVKVITAFLIYTLPPYFNYETFEIIYWYGTFADTVLFIATFTPVMAYVQGWLFRRLLFIHLPYWEIATITGGLIGAALMWLVRLNSPFEMLTWFAGIGLAQFFVLRPYIGRAWLWLLAQLCLSFFFPIYSGTLFSIVSQWLLATSVYGIATLFVLRELGQAFLEQDPIN